MGWGIFSRRGAFAWLAVGLVVGSSARAAAAPGADYPIRPVPFTAVEIKDGFWSPRLETNRAVTVRHDFDKCETTGRIANFAVAGGLAKGDFVGLFGFNDSDVYKVIEGASYSLRLRPDPGLEKYVDEVIAKIAAAQEDDGYLYTAGTIPTLAQKPTCCVSRPRWSDIASGHELYNLGHLYEAAVAHYQATGKRTLLDVALKSADLLTQVFGPGRRLDPPGHQEVEIGLVKLYRATGEKKYLDQARFFLEQRGNAAGHTLYGAYNQDHLPVLQQKEAVGHAVRAGYMYSAMADVGALTGDEGYVRALGGLWDNVVSRKLYLTGGIGARRDGRGLRRRLRAAEPDRLRRDLRRDRQRDVEPPPVPPARRREVPRRARAHRLQRGPLRRVARRRALLLPEPARLGRRAHVQHGPEGPQRLVRLLLLPHERRALPPLDRGLRLRAARARRLREPLRGRAGRAEPRRPRRWGSARRRATRGTGGSASRSSRGARRSSPCTCACPAGRRAARCRATCTATPKPGPRRSPSP